MTKKEIFELILKTSGFEMKNYEMTRDGSYMVSYEFEGHLDGRCEFQVATDSFEDAIRETLEGIYSVEGVEFNMVFKD
jgi:hypothetical protein